MADTLREASVDLDLRELSPVPQQFRERALGTPDDLALAVYTSGASTPTSQLTWRGWYQASRSIASHLIARGVLAGDCVAVLSGNTPVWPIADLAIQMIGAIGVGIYPTSTVAQVRALLADCGAPIAIGAGRAHVSTLLAARALLDRPPIIVAQSSSADVNTHAMQLGAQDALWSDWLSDDSRKQANGSRAAAALDARLHSLTLDGLAALIYTSGSTGVPKGACISHRYLAASARSIATVLELNAADRGLSFLPYSHAAERVFGQCTRISTGMSAALIEDPADVFRVARHFEPTLFGGLPRIFERLYEAAELARRNGDDPRAAAIERIGSHCRLATSGGAALPTHIARDLESLGLPILGAYGQTEHLCVAMNRPRTYRFDAVGLAMPGTHMRVQTDGELQIARSALTFSGYWKNADATRDAFTDDGVWLRTGDRAEIDADGMLRITGRVKEIIALSTGRKIAPVPIESALVASPFIAHAVCNGEGRKFLTALLSPRRAVVESWAREQGLELPWPALAHHPAVKDLLQLAVDAVNETLARTDRVQRFAITEQEFTLEGGELTPTFKVLRAVIAQRYASAFDALYL